MDTSLPSRDKDLDGSSESAMPEMVTSPSIGDDVIYERISDGFIVLDRNLRYTYVNHQTELLFGVRKEDLLGKLIWDVYPQARGTIFEEKYNEVLSTQKPTSFEAFYPTGQRWYELRIYPSDDGLDIFYEDLTLRKHAEQQLQFMSSISASISDAVIATDGDNRILSWNAAAQKLYGWQEAEVLGKDASTIVPTRFPYNPPKEWEERLLSRGEWQGECIQKRKDGTEIHIQAYISLVKDKDGNVIGRLAANRDITERKLFERSKDTFITIASHELRTPLTTMKMLIQLLKKTAERRSLPDFVRSLTRMEQQVNLLAKLVSVLVDGAKIQMENPLYAEEIIVLDELVSTTITRVQQTWPSHTLMLHGQSSTQVFGDRERLEQALTNLLENAVQYSPQANRVDVSLSVQDSFALIAVQDYGDGISKQEQRIIFDRFQRSYSPKHKTPAGLGLGLSIAYEIIKRHRGRISISSEEGKGALFTVFLPIYIEAS